MTDWNLHRLTLPIAIEGTTIYRPYPSGDLLICVDDNEGTIHVSLQDLLLYEKQRKLISCEALVGCMIEILYNQSEWRLALVLSYDDENCTHSIQFILRNASIMVSSSSNIVGRTTNNDHNRQQQQGNGESSSSSSSSIPSNTYITTLSDLNLDSIPAHHYSTRKASICLHNETFYVKVLSQQERTRMQALNEWKERRLEYPHWHDQIPSQYTLKIPTTSTSSPQSLDDKHVLYKDLSSTSTACNAIYYLAASMVHFAYCPTSADDNIINTHANTYSNSSGGSNDIDNHNYSNKNDNNNNNCSSSSNGNVDNIGQKRGSLERGHQLKGHRILRSSDCNMANKCKSSLLYGEFTARGLNKALDENHLKAHRSCRIMYDMGMGVGKAAMQAFLQCVNMERVVGIELTSGRYSIAVEAALQLCKQHPIYFKVRHYNPGIRCVISATEEFETLIRSLDSDILSSQINSMRTHPRVYELRCQDMYSCARELKNVDVLLLMTDITKERRKECMRMMFSLPIGARVLTYDDFQEITEKPSKIFGYGWLSDFSSGGIMGSWRSFGRLLSRQNKQRVTNSGSGNHDAIMNIPFIQVDVNKAVGDRFSATWSLNRGHHLFVYQRSSSPQKAASDVTDRLQLPQSDSIYTDIINSKDNIYTKDGGDEKSETDTEMENESDLSREFQPSTGQSISSLPSQYQSTSSSVITVSKRPQHTQSMFVSLFQLFPGNLLSFKNKSDSNGHNRCTRQ